MVKKHIQKAVMETCSCHYTGYSFLLATSDFYIHHPQTGRKEMFYLTTHSTHFIYGYMASYIW